MKNKKLTMWRNNNKNLNGLSTTPIRKLPKARMNKEEKRRTKRMIRETNLLVPPRRR
jgi:hypothetical protein